MSEDTNAERLFAAFLEEGGSDELLAELCARHPEVADEVRAMAREWRAMRAHLDESSTGAWVRTVSAVHATDPAAWSRFLEQLRARGSQRPRYVESHELGRGGMGVVSRVFDPDTRRYVAMKVLRDPSRRSAGSPGAGGSTRLSRFLEEAQVTAQLDHPGIVPVHEVGIDAEGRIYFTMKEVHGETLGRVLAKTALGDDGWTLPRAVQVIHRICEAVAYAHAKGVIHRDLKPDNVMVGRFGETYVMDWGLARLLQDPERRDLRVVEDPVRTVGTDEVGSPPFGAMHTQPGDALGTPYYMSPEQAEGRPGIGPATDVYAVGAILYQLLAGQPPYHDPSSRQSAQDVLSNVRTGAPRPIAEVAPGAPPELLAICEKAMSRSTARRYPRMTALAEDLRAYLENRIVSAHGGGAWAQLRLWVRRNRGMAAGLAIALVAVVGALGAVLLQQRSALAKERGLVAQLREAESDARAAEQKERSAKEQAEADRARAERDRESAREAEERARELAAERESLAELAAASASFARAEKERAEDAEAAAVVAKERALSAADDLRAAGEELQARNTELASARDDLEKRTLALQAELDRREPLVRSLRARLEAGTELARRLLGVRNEDTEIRSTTAVALSEWVTDAARLRSAAAELQVDFAANSTLLTEGDRSSLEAMGALVAALESEEQGRPTLKAMEYRAEVASRLHERAALSKAEWDSVIEEVADSVRCPWYRGLRIEQLDGLVPLGKNEETGLHEFWHFLSGPRPEGPLRPDPTRHEGMVFVLVPPGQAFLGAQSEDPGKWVYDATAAPNERPRSLGSSPIAAFYVSRCELTTNQVRTLQGQDPIAGGQLPFLDKTPAATRGLLTSFRLILPDERQWEYAARGTGRSLPYWFGRGTSRLPAAGNLDHAEDGYAGLAPVGQFLPNGFGLYDVIGNAAEWVVPRIDLYADSDLPDHLEEGREGRLVRGGSYSSGPFEARSAARVFEGPEPDTSAVGLRPIIVLEGRREPW